MGAESFQCTTVSNDFVTPTSFELKFELDHALEFAAGQFVSIVIPGAGPKGKNLRRAYSIASKPGNTPLEVCIRLMEGGPGSTYLSKLKPGDTFECFAPYGNFVFKTPPNRHAYFVATGTGVTPFRSIIHSKSYKATPPKSATILFGIREEEELLYHEEMSGLDHLNWIPCLTRGKDDWNGFRGRVTDYLRKLDDSFPWKETDFYLCGNGAMIKEVRAMLTDRGVEKPHVFLEAYFQPK